MKFVGLTKDHTVDQRLRDIEKRASRNQKDALVLQSLSDLLSRVVSSFLPKLWQNDPMKKKLERRRKMKMERNDCNFSGGVKTK